MGIVLGERFDRALDLACELHRRHWRKGSDTPYVAHLLAVASLVIEHGGDEDQAIAALLHDAVEDQGGAPTLERIRAAFGERVAAIVRACSDSDTVPKPPWRQRKEAYLAHLIEAPAEARAVSLADKVHNARCILADYRVIGNELWGRFTGGRDGSLWYYRALVETFRRCERGPLVDELERAVDELVRLVGER
jgi:(p)ppGpp synthase/HD superfamily hydrolase